MRQRTYSMFNFFHKERVQRVQSASKHSKFILSYSANDHGAHHLHPNLKKAQKVAAVMSSDNLTPPFWINLGTGHFRTKFKFACKGLSQTSPKCTNIHTVVTDTAIFPLIHDVSGVINHESEITHVNIYSSSQSARAGFVSGFETTFLCACVKGVTRFTTGSKPTSEVGQTGLSKPVSTRFAGACERCKVGQTQVQPTLKWSMWKGPIVHFIKKLSETCLYSLKACNYVSYSNWPPLMGFYIIETSKKRSHSNGQSESPLQCAQTCSWQEYLPTYRHESTWKLFSSWWWREQYSSSWQCSFKMKQVQNGTTAYIEQAVERNHWY